MISISKDNIILYHKKIIATTGGSSEIRDEGLIESAANRWQMTFDSVDLYPTIVDKISAVTHSLIKNHAFVDGNKRIGVAVMLLLLKLNGVEISFTQEALINIGLKTAEGVYSVEGIAEWINDHKA